jgi:flavodoxin
MKIEIRYFSKSSHTKTIAQAIAEVAGVEAKPISNRLVEECDVLFLCNSVYAAGIASPVKDFLKANDKKIGVIYNVSTAAIISSTYKGVAKLCKTYKLNLSDKEFHCKGSFSKKASGHPDATDVANAKKFAEEVLNIK